LSSMFSCSRRSFSATNAAMSSAACCSMRFNASSPFYCLSILFHGKVPLLPMRPYLLVTVQCLSTRTQHGTTLPTQFVVSRFRHRSPPLLGYAYTLPTSPNAHRRTSIPTSLRASRQDRCYDGRECVVMCWGLVDHFPQSLPFHLR
jgi:hypothetical protein